MQAPVHPRVSLATRCFMLWQALGTRFKIQPTVQAVPGIASDIQPVTDADEAHAEYIVQGATVPVTATGEKEMLAVPDGKRWLVIAFEIVISTGTMTFNYVSIKDASSALSVTLARPASVTSYLSNVLGQPLPLEMKDSITINADVVTVAGNFLIRVLVKEYDYVQAWD